MTPVEIASAVGAAIAAFFIARKEYMDRRKEKREKQMEAQFGLLPNPTRCDDHEKRLRSVEDQTARFDERSMSIQVDIGEIKQDVKALLSRV